MTGNVKVVFSLVDLMVELIGGSVDKTKEEHAVSLDLHSYDLLNVFGF